MAKSFGRQPAQISGKVCGTKAELCSEFKKAGVLPAHAQPNWDSIREGLLEVEAPQVPLVVIRMDEGFLTQLPDGERGIWQ
ncbi:MAG TPA: hypothetical protein VFF65_03910, partial [Phycisphaerales bacterium]|nr:hypothetical protein [Phycisphaerales bacterium]